MRAIPPEVRARRRGREKGSKNTTFGGKSTHYEGENALRLVLFNCIRWFWELVDHRKGELP